MKTKKSVLISCPAWGKLNRENFCNFSLRSLIYKGNIPTLLKNYDIVIHILTKKEDISYFKGNIFFKQLSKKVKIIFFIFKESFFKKKKYSSLTNLQNISINEAKKNDFIVFNYADFFWADFSLTNTIKKLDYSDNNFMTFFCLPVEITKSKKFIKSSERISNIEASKFAKNNLHREAKLRFWDDENFTMTPTFLLWNLGKEGLLIRAYHQTVLASKMKNNNLINLGINGITLDEYFSGTLGKDKFITNNDSNDIMVFALCDWSHDSQIRNGISKEHAIRKCFRRLNHSNHILAKEKIFIRSTSKINKKKTNEIFKESDEIISDLEKKFPVNLFIHYFITHKYFGPIAQYFARIMSILLFILVNLISNFKFLLSLYGTTINWIFYFPLLLSSKFFGTPKPKYPSNIFKYSIFRKFK